MSTRRSLGTSRSAGKGSRDRELRSPSRVLLGLRGELTEYLRAYAPDVAPSPLIDDMLLVVRVGERVAGLTELGGWSLEQVDRVLAALVDQPALDQTRASLGLLIGFLDASGRWTGDVDALDRLSGSLTSMMANALRESASRHHVPAHEAAAVAATEVVSTVTAFLSWLGGRPRPVTATGALRTGDTAAVIATLGLPAKPRKVTSMWDHPEVCAIWETALRGGLIVVSGSRVGMTPAGHALREGDPAAARGLVLLNLAHTLARPFPPFFPDGLPMGDVAKVALAALAGQGPDVPDAALVPPLPPDLLALALSIGAPRDDPAELDALASILFLQTLLHNEVFSVIDSRLQIVPGLEALVLTTIADILDDVPLMDGSTLLGSARAQGAVATDIGDAATGTVRLTVTLAGARPRVWRRVEIAASSTLADLHALLLEAFGRFDDHLHEFTTEDPIGRVTCYTGDLDEHGEDEAAITVAEVLGRAATLEYIYDLGAGWAHHVELDAVLARRPGPPQVVAGGGRAPTDDDGFETLGP